MKLITKLALASVPLAFTFSQGEALAKEYFLKTEECSMQLQVDDQEPMEMGCLVSSLREEEDGFYFAFTTLDSNDENYTHSYATEMLDFDYSSDFYSTPVKDSAIILGDVAHTVIPDLGSCMIRRDTREYACFSNMITENGLQLIYSGYGKF